MVLALAEDAKSSIERAPGSAVRRRAGAGADYAAAVERAVKALWRG